MQVRRDALVWQPRSSVAGQQCMRMDASQTAATTCSRQSLPNCPGHRPTSIHRATASGHPKFVPYAKFSAGHGRMVAEIYDAAAGLAAGLL